MSDEFPVCRCGNPLDSTDDVLCAVCADASVAPPAEVATLATMHECPSCHAFIFNAKRFEGHEPECMQPEIRMRRLEARVAMLEQRLHIERMQRLCDRPMDGR